MDSNALYLAYGSNLHPLRIQQRLKGCKLVGTLNLPGFALKFHKRSQDGSGKCNLVPAARRCSHGALYQLRSEHWPILDQLEGGYRRTSVLVELEGRHLPAFTYFAEPEFVEENLEPFDWYLELVRRGIEFLQLPQNTGLDNILTTVDINAERNAVHQKLLHDLARYQFDESAYAKGLIRGDFVGITGE